MIERAGIDAIGGGLKIGPKQGNAHRLETERGDLRQIVLDFCGVEVPPNGRTAANGEITET